MSNRTFAINFKLQNETKGALRYQEVNSVGQPADPYMIGTLYVRKSAFQGWLAFPKTLQITLEVIE